MSGKTLKVFFLLAAILLLASGLTPARAEETTIGALAADAQAKHALGVVIPEFTLNGVVLKQDRSRPKPDSFQDAGNRRCPPFCVQAETVPGATTIQVEDFQKMAADINAKKILLVDLRTPEWFQSGTLPQAINLPFSDLAGPEATVKARLEKLAGKDIIAFCNGWWCGQSPAGITALLALGYPGKIYYFRDGNQGWVDAGLPLVKP
ncbi:MAG: rhodanese-like domain-containing protein [Magnetococcales bacterium]|nr:rhodanese-like domain-containing protein [Magnetococcales bacterium]